MTSPFLRLIIIINLFFYFWEIPGAIFPLDMLVNLAEGLLVPVWSDVARGYPQVLVAVSCSILLLLLLRMWFCVKYLCVVALSSLLWYIFCKRLANNKFTLTQQSLLFIH